MLNKDYEEIIDFCYRANYGRIDEFAQHDGYLAAFSKELKDFYYNHLIPIDGTDCKELLLSRKDEFLSRGRVPAIYTTPLSFNYKNPVDGLKCLEMESFLWYDREDAPAVPTDKGYVVKIAGADRVEKYIEIFNAAFSTGVYAGLIGPEYAAAERRFFGSAPRGFQSLIFLVEHQGRAVGSMCAAIGGDMAFLYSMAVLPDARAGGLAAKQLGAAVLRELFDRGATNIFSQTEYDSKLEHFYNYYGFERLFLGRYWAEE
jgi:GNAT superfamily N-acetyltransferase